ncbi:A/G-specific DNA-adenine glycosylase [Pseudidiomarina planktonica]|uniref:Adenine DNA glycosylase n=1 Tax=Pseudidiomarina planktonica TaxID=1323738 RepID=A0A1Y6G537_9GAMM|nr:A/G-specific adenine glycosylase [Pseudidiomarina planktonica]RUO62924.1 A/G-specific adenine glycosylase [Pseudidiomarina planktonica]SMQ80816.1 A/G-specific DNA-adenine glycosylase [Pseudidiomarina planktonica]
MNNPPPLSTGFIDNFARRVVSWQASHGRHDLPWQQQPTPYQVLVSEVMLQQTQVSTVIPYYQRWLAQFPDAESLAAATDDEVMALWQGLGYYARARNLKKAASYICTELAHQVPQQPEQLREIPGVGPYTAGAITNFAYNKPAAIVDGNIKRLFCRLFGIHGQLASTPVTKQVWQLAEQLTPATNNRSYAQGLLDLGATICKPRSPLCKQCPLASDCVAFQQDLIHELPTPKVRKSTPTKSGFFLWLMKEDKIYLVRRPKQGIWSQLWCLPELSSPQVDKQVLQEHGTFKHVFSHYKLNAHVYQPSATTNEQQLLSMLGVNEELHGSYVAVSELAAVGLPAPIRSYLEATIDALQ